MRGFRLCAVMALAFLWSLTGISQPQLVNGNPADLTARNAVRPETRSAKPNVSVIYTGKLYGYMRLDGCDSLREGEFPEQLAHPEACVTPKPGDSVTQERLNGIDQDKNAVNCFLKSLAEERQAAPSSLLLGTGDNFAPRLEARMERDKTTSNPAQWWRPRSKNPANTDDTNADPVSCFLRAARYDAIVVGLEDFALGPERIRNIANFLRSPDAKTAVRVVGANVVFNVHFKDPGDAIPDTQKKPTLVFENLDNGQQYFQPQSSEPFLPTVRYLEFRVPLVTNGTAAIKLPPNSAQELRKWGAIPLNFNSGTLFADMLMSGHFKLCGPYSDLDGFSPANCVALEHPQLYQMDEKVWGPLTGNTAHQVDECRQIIKIAMSEPREMNLGDVREQLSALHVRCGNVIQGQNMDLTNAVVPSVRLRWQVSADQFEPKGIKDFEGDKSYRFCVVSQQTATGLYCQRLPIRRPLFKDNYVFLRDRNVVIFGIVDQGLRGELPDPQGSWLEKEKWGRKVEIETVDPQAALVQAQDAFRMDHAGFDGRKVLLAHMDAHKLEDLVASLASDYSVDLAIAEADAAHATPGETIEVPTPEAGRLPVLIPFTASDSRSKNLSNPLSTARLAESGKNTQLVTAHHQTEKLKFFDENDNRQSALIGLSCPTGLSDHRIPPKMLGLLRCATKEYLFRIGQDERVIQGPQQSLGSISTSSEFVEAVLQIMRRTLRTDLAMLERRELYGIVEADTRSGVKDYLYDPDKNDPAYLRKFLDRILWEDSTLQKITVNGATLKKILKQSAAFKSQEDSTTERVLVHGRSLFLAGLTRGSGKDEIFVNGRLVDDAGQYSVASSERMLTVNSDYPDLRKDLADNTVEIDSSRHAAYISYAVCDELRTTSYLKGARCTPGTGSKTEVEDYQRPERKIFAARASCDPALRLLQDGWCDTGAAHPADMLEPHKGMGQGQRFISSLGILSGRGVNNPFQIPSKKAGSLVTGAELADQFQRTHRLSVSELSFAVSTHHPDQNAQQLSTNFNSALLSTVNQPQSSSWDAKNTTRFTAAHYVIRGDGLDLYMSDDVAFSSVDQSGTGAFPHKITLNKNQWAAVPFGLAWNFSASVNTLFGRKPDRALPMISLILEPSRFTGQLIGTDNLISASQILTAGQACNGTTSQGVCTVGVDVPQERTLSYSPRLGLRTENQLSYLEFGGQLSRDWRVPLQFVFTPSAGTTFPCNANDLNNCLSGHITSITNSIRVQQINTARSQLAVYVDSTYKLPLHRSRKIYFVLKNKGELYANSGDDTPVLTKYDYTMTSSISVPLFRNLAVEPNVELFWYENKAAFNDLFKRSYTIKLNYTIDWNIGRVRAHDATKSSPYSSSPSGSTN